MSVKKPTHELAVGEILLLTVKLYLAEFPRLFLPFLLAGAVMGVSTYLVTSAFPIPTPPTGVAEPEELVAWLSAFLSSFAATCVLLGVVAWIVGTITVGVAVKHISSRLERESCDLMRSLTFTLSRLPTLLANQLIFSVLVGIGLILFVVPGIIVTIVFLLAIPVAIIEEKGTFESLGRSKKLASNRWLKILVLLLILGIVTFVMGGVASTVALPLASAHPISSPLVTFLLSALAAPIYPIAITFLYYALATRDVPPPSPPPPSF